ncbi:hypothetical protein EEF74_12355, partial [Neisseria gonorrhoeae]
MMLNRVSIVLFPFGRFYGSGSDSRRLRHSLAGGNPDLGTTAIFKDYLKVRDSGFPLSRESRRSGWRVKCLRPPFQAASGFQGAGPAPL